MNRKNYGDISLMMEEVSTSEGQLIHSALLAVAFISVAVRI
jgi:hypothetical protein